MKFQPKIYFLRNSNPTVPMLKEGVLLNSSSTFPCGYDARLALEKQLLLFRVLKGKNFPSALSRTKHGTNHGAFKPPKPKQLTRIFTRFLKWQQRDFSNKPHPFQGQHLPRKSCQTVVTNTHSSKQVQLLSSSLICISQKHILYLKRKF